MKKTFLIDRGKIYSYADLIYNVKNQVDYSPAYRYRSLFDFYVNLLTGLISNTPIILIDSDISESEIVNLGVEEIGKRIKIDPVSVVSFNNFLDRINNSSSKITIFTSGTTGLPKKVEHTVSSLIRTVSRKTPHKSDIWGFAYNPTHMAGLQVFFQAFENGNTIVNMFGKNRSDVLAAIEQYQITHISATPTFYRLLKPVERSFTSVKRVTFGGERSNSKLYESIIQLFPNAKITNVYASTEAGSLLASNGEGFEIPHNLKEKFKILNNELLIHKSLLGFSDSFSYDKEFYQTGDIIEWIDELKGIFRFKNRKNELINVGGYKVNPNEVEDCIRSISGIKDAKVYGKPNSILGNILCVDIVCDDSKQNIDKTYIFENLRHELQDYKIPRRINFKESIDLTRSGKVKR